jgi:hypothetical protein
MAGFDRRVVTHGREICAEAQGVHAVGVGRGQPRLLYVVLLRQAANLFDVAAYPVRGNLENLRLRLA